MNAADPFAVALGDAPRGVRHPLADGDHGTYQALRAQLDGAPEAVFAALRYCSLNADSAAAQLADELVTAAVAARPPRAPLGGLCRTGYWFGASEHPLADHAVRDIPARTVHIWPDGHHWGRLDGLTHEEAVSFTACGRAIDPRGGGQWSREPRGVLSQPGLRGTVCPHCLPYADSYADVVELWQMTGPFIKLTGADADAWRRLQHAHVRARLEAALTGRGAYDEFADAADRSGTAARLALVCEWVRREPVAAVRRGLDLDQQFETARLCAQRRTNPAAALDALDDRTLQDIYALAFAFRGPGDSDPQRDFQGALVAALTAS